DSTRLEVDLQPEPRPVSIELLATGGRCTVCGRYTSELCGPCRDERDIEDWCRACAARMRVPVTARRHPYCAHHVRVRSAPVAGGSSAPPRRGHGTTTSLVRPRRSGAARVGCGRTRPPTALDWALPSKQVVAGSSPVSRSQRPDSA